jgi:cell division inhibitor SepF
MSGAMRRIGEYLGLLEDTGRYDDHTGEYEAYDEADYTRESPVVSRAPQAREPKAASAKVADLAERRRPQVVPDLPGAPEVTEMSRIVTLQPTTYNDARAVGEHYRDGTPVIMNLSEMEDADAKRLVDFAAGLIFATHGDIERVTSKVFLLSPHNVSVAAEAKERIVQGGFFNQS